jgi:hypothetical protein
MATDIHKLIGEVAARNHLRVDDDDPIFAVCTINRLMLEDAMDALLGRVRVAVAEFESAARAVEARSGRALAEEVRKSAAAWKAEITQDINMANLRSCELVNKIDLAHSRPAMLRWGALGLFAGLILLSCGVFLGTLIR